MYIPVGVLTLLILVIVLPFIIFFSPAKIDKQNKESILSSAKTDFKIYHKYIKKDYYTEMDGFESYLLKTSEEKIIANFTPVFKKVIEHCIKEFKVYGSINSLCALKIFKNDIINDWDKFKGTTLKIPCFLKDWYTLSASPVSQELYVETTDNIFISSHFDYSIDIHNRPNEKSDPLNIHKTISISNDDIPPFIIVYAKLNKDSNNHFVLENCHSEYYSYTKFFEEINKLN